MEFNLHIYQTGVAHESRLQRHCEALRDSDVFSRVEFLGCSDEGDRKVTFGDNLEATLLQKPDTRSLGLFSKIFATRRWGHRAAAEAIRLAPDCITCHSLPVLSVCAKAKRKLGCRLVYEPHELETETVVSRGLRRRMARYLERKLINECDEIITVCESIADWYVEAYGVPRPCVVRNLPKNYKLNDSSARGRVFRDKFEIPDDEQLFLYQGLLGRGRRVDQYLAVFSALSSPYHVVFMGDGDFREQIRAASGDHGNVHYQEAVAADEVLHYTASADIGLCGVENICLSYYYSLPNKIFEYMTAGIPSLVPDFPEMSRFIRDTDAGWLHGDTNDELAQCIRGIKPEESAARRAKAVEALSLYSWEKEQQSLIEAYRRVMKEK